VEATRTRLVTSFLCSASLWLLARAARADDECRRAAEAHLRKHQEIATAIYWKASSASDYLRGGKDTPADAKLVYYVTSDSVTDSDLRIPAGMRLETSNPVTIDPPNHCARLFARRYVTVGNEPPPPCSAPPANDLDQALAKGPDEVIKRYRGAALTGRAYQANGAADVASETAQILGQIVVDRASQAAYAHLARKLTAWLHCGEADGHFAATCTIVRDLRVQDLAMAPGQLRRSLAADALAWAGMDAAKGHAGTGGIDPVALIASTIEARVLPLLDRPADAISGRAAEVVLRPLVDRGLAIVEAKATAGFCALSNQDRVLATAAAAFAACELQNPGDGACEIMRLAETFDRSCKESSPGRLAPAHLAYAESIAGHLLDALSLKKDGAPDGNRRLAAAADATFEIACMYAVPGDDDSGYRCALDPAAHDAHTKPLTAAEKVAVARDVVGAALDRDGAAMVAAIARAAIRILPAPDAATEPKALRVLATVAAYSATYAGSSAPDDAHKQRTALLESLTRDMTDRTGRGGDAIISLGGALRLVGGGRFGHQVDGRRLDALASPLSLPLGFALDVLEETHARGLHAELSLLDLGQYLAWDEGGKVARPDLANAFAPTLTVGYAWGRELPFYVAATAGISPNFDFAPDTSDKPRGALTIGVAFGIYVPLLDLN
jgi:hypothetical protein